MDLKLLPWLVEPPQNFRTLLKETEHNPDRFGLELSKLARYGLGSAQLANLVKRLNATGNFDPLLNFRLGILSNATTDLLAPCIAGSAIRHGIKLETVEAPFDQVFQQAMNPESDLNLAKADAVLLALDHRGIPLDDGPEAAVEYITSLRHGVRGASGAIVIVQTLPCLPETLFGSLDARTESSNRFKINKFNRLLIESIENEPDILLDVCGLAEAIGLNEWHDPVQWHMAKLPFSQTCAPIYADYVARLLSTIRGRSKKCLVLDLDNTLWGGVIGDDGLEGIRLGQGDAIGEAFIAVQQMAIDLRARGIVLAVCSKNDDQTARKPFREHPDMLLKENHIAVFQANWEDKATNLEAIAESLNLNVDALVFLDDNPVERAQVREALPSVAVPELPNDPALFPRTLLFGGYFEAIAISEDDQNRAAQYQENAARVKLKGKSRDLNSFLESLNMEISFAAFDGPGRSRIAQLINKSNQFNLTSKRYTESEILAMENDPSVITVQVRLIDRFGDNGMISVVICRIDDEHKNSVEIDTWLMSCRVLGRRVEEAVLGYLIQIAKERSKTSILGTYIVSGRNQLVADHYKGLGFGLVKDTPRQTTWRLDLSEYKHPNIPMSIKSHF
jgi:FkbH-like protein